MSESINAAAEIDAITAETPNSIHITPPPYFMPWQRIAVKKLAQLLVELGSECHMSIEEFAALMDAVTSQVREQTHSVHVATPPPAPSAPSIFEDF